MSRQCQESSQGANMLIGISGKKRTGKDTIAEHISSAFGEKCISVAFADPIKDALSAAYQTFNIQDLTGLSIVLDDFYEGGRYDRDNFELPMSKAAIQYWLRGAIKVLHSLWGPTGVNLEDIQLKPGPWTIRKLMQELGTNIVGSVTPNYWIDITRKTIESSTANGYTVLVSDVRYDHEADALRNIGAIMIFTQRDTSLTDDHISEAGITPKSTDHVIINNGTIEDLYSKVDKILEGN